MMNKAVVVAGLTVVRGGRTVLEDFDLEVSAGEVTGLLGPSGCGKSTLLRALVGVQKVAGGTVTVLGEPAGSRPLRDRIGYVTQASSVYDDLSVTENLRFFARVLDAEPDSVARAIDAVDLDSHRHAVVRNLSGGQRSRVSLAAALLNTPDVLILDEPTVGLDPVLRRDLWNLFHRLAADGAVVIVSSHVMDEAERCDRLLLMREGRLLFADPPQALKDRTGIDDIEGAFLSLVEAEGSAA